jgi:hypothetical protein
MATGIHQCDSGDRSPNSISINDGILGHCPDNHKKLDFARLPKYSIVAGKLETWSEPKKISVNPDRKIQTGPPKVMKKPFCQFCYNRRRPSSEFKSHFTKTGPEFGSKIVCPLLLAQQCARCGEIGHTPKQCNSEHHLCFDPNERGADLNYSYFHLSILSMPNLWQHPVPPALQAKHAEWERTHVKTSRIWITMSGDHSEYTNDFAICYGGPNWVSFDKKTKTEYELSVESHYQWMRRNIKK